MPILLVQDDAVIGQVVRQDPVQFGFAVGRVSDADEVAA
jgi:DNA-binding response OmpR family regulator